MRFRPRFCPHDPCRFLGRARCQRRGFFRRQCDGRLVQRFYCHRCRRTFSLQTFRLDYRLKKPALHLFLFKDFVSKVTHRQSARTLGCTRRTVAHRLRLLSAHARAFHARALARSSGRVGASFQLDELESYETDRRLQPVTMPVLIEKESYFLVHLEVAPMPARGGLRAYDRGRKAATEARLGRRKSGSSAAVTRCFEALARWVGPSWVPRIATDRKTSYPGLIRKAFARGAVHYRWDSKLPRNCHNPLFAINLTLAMLRDGVSRLVRRTWAAAKLRERLADHAWIWLVYRNYVRAITNKVPHETPAMKLRVTAKKWRREELFAWRVFAPAA